MPKSFTDSPVEPGKTVPRESPPTALSLFSGCGGFCEGIESSGFEVRAAVELDKYACETYRHNFPRTKLFEGDVQSFLTEGTDHVESFRVKGVDLVFGGPPCQGFSQIGMRRLDDERNELYQQYTRIVAKLKPRVFLMENVPNLALMNKGHFKHLILKEFADLGYSNTVMLRVSADDYGVPQTRQRVIFVGTRDEEQLNVDLGSLCEWVLEGLKVARPVTVAEAISDLPAKIVDSGDVMPYPKTTKLTPFQKDMRLDHDGTHYTKAGKRKRGLGNEQVVLHNHHTKEMQAKRAHLISFLKPGMKADSLPKHIWNGARPEKWRRLHPDLPSYTILAQMHRDMSEWVHPHLERWITVREAARLQSFHDGFVFKGSEWQQLKQVGNAVPPLLGNALGHLAQEILRALDSKQQSQAIRSTGARPATVQRLLVPA
ncbi:DNA-methyltransferase Dcm [Variovorax sp. CF313]|uniref:DNA cytosine methyltransferase n=1 Tax=Variovorax sp. CF313 TaxID=1144315 RepID=UPI000270EB94|nr:DNA cytosine methyltransferase [Variovorax sp. CF313]EJL77459.1 DNA-methyltransferase Dcm [Variovorax sp. CF313]